MHNWVKHVPQKTEVCVHSALEISFEQAFCFIRITNNFQDFERIVLGTPKKAHFIVEYGLERHCSLCIKAAPVIALAS